MVASIPYGIETFSLLVSSATAFLPSNVAVVSVPLLATGKGFLLFPGRGGFDLWRLVLRELHSSRISAQSQLDLQTHPGFGSVALWYSTQPFFEGGIPLLIVDITWVSLMSNDVFRLNVIDEKASVSFLGPAHAMKAVAAACSHGATSWQDVIAKTRRYDPDWAEAVLRGLLMFEEHHVPSDDPNPPETDTVDASVPFRIWDVETRRCSMEPGRLGLVIFNLKELRIIQVQNSYSELQRQGRGRIRSKGKPTPRIYHYKLPEDWAILP